VIECRVHDTYITLLNHTWRSIKRAMHRHLSRRTTYCMRIKTAVRHVSSPSPASSPTSISTAPTRQQTYSFVAIAYNCYSHHCSTGLGWSVVLSPVQNTPTREKTVSFLLVRASRSNVAIRDRIDRIGNALPGSSRLSSYLSVCVLLSVTTPELITCSGSDPSYYLGIQSFSHN
jgi:hypothetical protein